ncbi:MAG: hypothetical protein V2I40_06355, partial [Desulfobacteraceae bacterium]|nr:hypothetical protein [Desulfobacteraceae bacterium]
MHSNHRYGLMILLLVVLVGLTTGSATAATISYQGRLTDDLGLPLSGPVDLIFTIYDAPDATGMILWQEAQSVMVESGIFNVALGSVTPLPDGLFEQEPLYLEITVDDPGGAEVLTPRQPITATALAMVAEKSHGLTDGALTSVMIADGAVTANQIADGTVTAAKIAGGFVPNLDADLLDGLSANAFSPVSHTHDTRYYTQAHVDALETRIAALEAKLQHLAVVAGTVNGMPGPHVIITGANLHVINGSGYTGVADGTGNLIVGYNE